MAIKIVRKIGIIGLWILGSLLIISIVVPVSDAIFHWSGPEGAMYTFGYGVGHVAKDIVNLF